MTIETLAEMMNTTTAEVAVFVKCLSVWTAKGYSVEEAIVKHEEQMARLVNHAADIAYSEKHQDLRQAIAADFWEAVNAPKAVAA